MSRASTGADDEPNKVVGPGSWICRNKMDDIVSAIVVVVVVVVVAQQAAQITIG